MPDRIAYSQMTVERVLNKDAATPEPRNGGIRAVPYDVNARIGIGT
jgi:hypothetical protein